MLDTDDVALWYELSRFTTRYWFDVDFNGGNDGHEFIFPTRCSQFVKIGSRGRRKFRAFYVTPAAWRDNRPSPGQQFASPADRRASGATHRACRRCRAFVYQRGR
jgi:hypothetical protein